MAFNNIFDSSLVDYSKDFEQNDEIHKNKVEYGEKLLTEATVDHFVETLIRDEFDDLLSKVFIRIENKLESIDEDKYVEDVYSSWSYDGIPETVQYYIWKDEKNKECLKLFGVDVDHPESDPKCYAYNTVNSNIVRNYINNKKIKKLIAEALNNKISEYVFHTIEDSYLEDVNK